MNVQNRDALKAQIKINNTAKVESTVLELEKLRLELKKSHTATDEAKKLHVQQNMEIEKLKVALANEAANLKTELSAKWDVSKER